MFRLTLISIIALRVIMCPVFCVGTDGDLRVHDVESTATCSCAQHEGLACHGDRLPGSMPFDKPCNFPCPCDTGCVCQVTPELNSRTVSADIMLTLDLSPMCLDTLDLSENLSRLCDEQRSHRFDLQSGRDVRLVHASLLL